MNNSLLNSSRVNAFVWFNNSLIFFELFNSSDFGISTISSSRLGNFPFTTLNTRVSFKFVVTKKSDESKKKMLQHAKTFGGTLTDVEMIKLLGIDKNTYYKYKKELKNARLCAKIAT